MDTASFASPDVEITALRALLAEREATLAERDALLLNTKLEIEKLKVLLARARREQYGQSSERLAAEAGQLEMLIGDLEESQAQADAKQRSSMPGKSRQQPVRKPLPAHLPRERAAIIYTIAETAKLNGNNPEAYITTVLDRLAKGPRRRRQMTDLAGLDAFGSLTEPATLTISRLLPGSIERVWAYLTDETLRRQWLAAGAVDLRTGAPFEFVSRNEEISDPPGARPAGFPAEHRMQSSIIALDALRLLVIAWGVASEVTFELAPQCDQVPLTVIHRRLPDQASMLKVSAGWHAHLDALGMRLAGRSPTFCWDG